MAGFYRYLPSLRGQKEAELINEMEKDNQESISESREERVSRRAWPMKTYTSIK